MLKTSSIRLNVLSWIISSARVRKTMSGTTAMTDARELALSSAMPPRAIGVALGQVGVRAPRSPASSSSTISSGSVPGATSDWTVSVGSRSRRQMSGWSWVYVEGRELAQRHRPPVRQRHRKVAQGRDRHGLSADRPGDDVDEVDVVANLGDRLAGHRGARAGRRPPCELRPSRRASSWSTRMCSSRAGSIQLKLTSRDVRARGDGLGEAHGDGAHLARSRVR